MAAAPPERRAPGRSRGPARALALAALLAGCGGAAIAPDAVVATDAPPGPGGWPDTDPPPERPDCVAGRVAYDQRDDVDGFQIKVVYALPADGDDAGLDTDGTLARTVAAWNAWLAARTGGAALRLDTCDGALDVAFLRLAQTDAEIAARGAYVREALEEAIQREPRLARARKVYAVYYGGRSTYACGGGAWPPALRGRVAALYLGGEPPGARPCRDNPFAPSIDQPGYLEHAMLHELFHTLGGVATCAPHHTRSGHTSDAPHDLMYAGDEPWRPSALDVGGDDYWGHGDPGCLDLARSAFVEPLPAGAAPPPAW